MPSALRLLPRALHPLKDPADEDIAPQPLEPLRHLHLEPSRTELFACAGNSF